MRTATACLLITLLASALAQAAENPAAILKGCGGVAVAFSDDGTRILTAGAGRLRVVVGSPVLIDSTARWPVQARRGTALPHSGQFPLVFPVRL